MFKSVSEFTPSVWLVIVATMATRFTFFMVWPYLAVILHRDHGLGVLEIGAFISTSSLFGNFIGFYVGFLSDRFGRPKIIVWGLCGSVVAVATLGLTESLWVMLFAMILQSITRNAIESPGKALITDLLESRAAKDLALHLRYYALNIGASFGPVVGVAWGISGKQTTFLLVAAILATYLVFAIFIFFREVPSKGSRDAEFFSFRDVLHTLSADRRFLIFVLAMFLGLIAYSQLEVGLVQYLQLALHPDVVGFYSMVTVTNGMTVLVFQFPLLAITRALSPQSRSMLGIALMSVAFSILAVSPVTNSAVLLGAVFILTLGEVILFPTLQILIDRMAPTGMKGAYFGAAALSGFGFALGSVVGGSLLRFLGGPGLWWGMAALTLVVAWLYWRAGRLGPMGEA